MDVRGMLVCLWIAVALSGGAAAQPRSEVDTAAAHRAALTWLALVDSGAYSASLDSAAPMLRRMIASGEQWEEFLRGARNGLGPGVIRELLDVELEPSLPVMLDGRYLRLTFRIRRARRTATESVVLQELDDGWRVAMYGLRGEP